MNCQDFEKAINDITRDHVLEMSERASALSHAEACEQCRARRDDQLELTAGLGSLAASMSKLEAPAQVEMALLKAMRERKQNVLPFERREAVAPAPSRTYRQWRWAAAIAAGIALTVLGFAVLNMRERQSPRETVAGLSASPSDRAIAPPIAVGTEDESVPEAAPTVAGGGLQMRPTNVVMRTSGGSRPSMRDERRRINPVNIPGAAATAAEANEKSDIATDFFPINYGSDLSNLESGRVVRVELPRSTMAQFGLPVNAERAGEPVKADVLIGEDGLAQAIRFVR